MLFNSTHFVVFAAVVVPLVHGTPSRLRPALLVAASYIYYFSWSVPYAGLLFAVTAAVYGLGLLLGPRSVPRKQWRILLAGLALLAANLTIFKYGDAFLDVLRRGWPSSVGLDALHVLAPVGISYYTFKLISYLVDVYWERLAAERRFDRFAAYVAFFPQIPAGPIQRAVSFLPQLESGKGPDPEQVTSGLRRILLGLFKKVVVADHLALVVNQVYSVPTEAAWLALYLFPLQLYADFSGLSDMAIGLGRLLGIEAPENFDVPFLATNISDFWRRWHMTLTQWLGDYVFTPLRMALRNTGQVGLVVSILVNMTAIGVWHGPRATYVAFGLVHAFYVTADALTARRRGKYFKAHRRLQRWAGILGPVLTFHLVAVSFVLFRAESLDEAFAFFGRLGTSGSYRLPFDGRASLALGLLGYALVEGIEVLRRQGLLSWIGAALKRPGRWLVYYAAIGAIAVFGKSDVPFIYFKF